MTKEHFITTSGGVVIRTAEDPKTLGSAPADLVKITAEQAKNLLSNNASARRAKTKDD